MTEETPLKTIRAGCVARDDRNSAILSFAKADRSTFLIEIGADALVELQRQVQVVISVIGAQRSSAAPASNLIPSNDA